MCCGLRASLKGVLDATDTRNFHCWLSSTVSSTMELVISIAVGLAEGIKEMMSMLGFVSI